MPTPRTPSPWTPAPHPSGGGDVVFPHRIIPAMALRAVACVVVLAIALFDTLSTLEGAVAVLYVLPVLLVARTGRRGDIIAVAVAGAGLTLCAYLDTHGIDHVGPQTVRALVSLVAIAIAAVLALQNQRSMRTLADQAVLLDLSHDMIFVRDPAGVIGFWNLTAEQVYGWSREEAAGQPADRLLQTRYPAPRSQIEADLLQHDRWEGLLAQRTRDGRTLWLESRWVLQRDRQGRPLRVLETHTDVSERQAAHAALVRSEQRYRRMFDGSRIGVVEQDWSEVQAELSRHGVGDRAQLQAYLQASPQALTRFRQRARLVGLNPAFRRLIGEGAPPATVDAVLADDDRTFAASLAAFVAGAPHCEGETSIVRADGSTVPVLFTITFPDRREGDGTVLVFVVDIHERKQAEARALAAQAELAHASRVATLGELTASLAHEVNQPLMAVVTNGEAGLRWLRRPQPELHEVELAIERTIAEGRRASGIVKNVRDFLGKTPPAHEVLAPAVLVDDALRLLQHELQREQVQVQVDQVAALPDVPGQRIQLQQVLVNLLLNACQAMSGQPGVRALHIELQAIDGHVRIDVSDTGPGIAAEHVARLFEPFFTTKPQGMGMGLPICRTTVEAHGGQLQVRSTPGTGTCFTLLLATAPETA
ncbi:MULTISPECIES: ATP-binding protein [Stenotrophomonas]|uniref:PAS domain-containing sensor histidine kinase n=1 Tax=Stenotrophomonas TaxID=40323 RepID=UPI001902848F|nr:MULTISPECIES: ATP-binding protein [Stenotrophomonas]